MYDVIAFSLKGGVTSDLCWLPAELYGLVQGCPEFEDGGIDFLISTIVAQFYGWPQA